jgi:hypothetical protein
MSYMGNAMIELAEAGAVMAEVAEVQAWRAAGHTVPLVWVEVDTYRGRRNMPAMTLETAERLAGSLDDEEARETLRQAVADARSYLAMVGRVCNQCGCTGQRHYFVNTGSETLCVDCG